MEKFLALLYKPKYLSLLEDIKRGSIEYKDVKAPQTSEGEYYKQILLDGLHVNCEQHDANKNVISPQLSLHHMSDHARKEMLSIVSLHFNWIMGYHSPLIGWMSK